MASPSLALPGVLFVGEDERARLVAHLGSAAGWMIPKGVLGWSHEVSVVQRDALTEAIRRDARIVMPEEQIPAARMPLAHQAAQKSPLVAVSSRITQKLVDAGIRVHTVGADRVTSSFYYIGEGGSEPQVRVEGDLVAAVGAMLGERADNAAIERVLDGLVDRLLRSLSKDRITELSLELAAALPRASADGTGLQDIDLESFEKELSALVGASEKYKTYLEEIAAKVGDTNERKVEIPLYLEAKKSSQGPFELEVGVQKVALGTHDRWLLTGPLTEPSKAAPAPAPKAEPVKAEPVKAEPVKAAPAPTPAPAPAKAMTPQPAPAKPAPTPSPVPASTKPASQPTSAGNIRPLAAPMNPPRPASTPPKAEVPSPSPQAAAPAPEPVKVVEPEPVKAIEPEPVKIVEPAPVKVVEPKPEPAVEKKAEPAAPKVEESRAVAKAAASTPPVAPPTKKGGFPILWIVIAIALAFAAYRIFLAKH